jgi:hypothetical protein
MTEISKNAELQQSCITAVMHSNLSLSQQIELEIAKIFFLSNQINRKTKLCCFVNDTAHCGYIEVKLHSGKDKYTETPVMFKLDYEINEEYSWKTDSKDRLNECNRCVEFLEKTLKDEKIDYNFLYAVKEYVITSYEI